MSLAKRPAEMMKLLSLRHKTFISCWIELLQQEFGGEEIGQKTIYSGNR